MPYICDKNGMRFSETCKFVEKEEPFTGWNGETGIIKSKLVYTGDKNELLGKLIFGDRYFDGISRPDGSKPLWYDNGERIEIPEEGVSWWFIRSFFVEVVEDDGFKGLHYACQDDDPNLRHRLLYLRGKSIDFEEVRYPIPKRDQIDRWDSLGEVELDTDGQYETEEDFIRYVCEKGPGVVLFRNLKWPIDDLLLPAEPR